MAIDEAWILTLNAGSSSLKFAAFSLVGNKLIAAGQIAAIGSDARLVSGDVNQTVLATDHRQAVSAALLWLQVNADLSTKPSVIAHRIVHGGTRSMPM